MKCTISRLLGTAALLLSGMEGTSYASTIQTYDQAAWTALVSNISNYDFGTGPQATYNTSTGLVTTGLQILGTNGAGFNLTVNPATPSYNDWGTGDTARGADYAVATNPTTRIKFISGTNFSTAAPVSAFGFYFGLGNQVSGTNQVVITPEGSPSYTFDITPTAGSRPNWAFFGIVSDMQTFSYVDVRSNTVGTYLIVDEIKRADFTASGTPPSEAPELATIFCMLTGLSFLGASKLRRRAAIA